jgi:hypothetical protein
MLRAIRAAARAFVSTYYRRQYHQAAGPRLKPVLPAVPLDYAARLIGLRRRLQAPGLDYFFYRFSRTRLGGLCVASVHVRPRQDRR